MMNWDNLLRYQRVHLWTPFCNSVFVDYPKLLISQNSESVIAWTSKNKQAGVEKRWYREASESEVLLSESLVFRNALFYHDNELDSQVERWMLGSLKVSSTVLGILLITFTLVIRLNQNLLERATAPSITNLNPSRLLQLKKCILHLPSQLTRR